MRVPADRTSTPEGDGPTHVVGYRNAALRLILLVVFPIAAVAAVGLVVAAAAGTGPPRVFSAVVVIAVVWNAYWFLYRIGHSIEIRGPSVRWTAVLRRRDVDLVDLTGFETPWKGFEQLRVREAPSLMVVANHERWLGFIAELDVAVIREKARVRSGR